MEEVNNFIKSKPYFVSIITSFCLFSVFYCLFTPSFMTNDDVGMMLWASGTSLSSEPIEFISFSNVLIGLILNKLYLINGHVSWYGFYLLISMFLSFFSLLLLIIKQNLSVSSKVMVSIILFLAMTKLLMFFQFTMAASICAIAGLVHFVLTDERDSKIFLFAGGLLVFSSLIRFESFEMIAIIIIPLVFFNQIIKRTWFYKQNGILIVSIFLCILLNQFNSFYYAQNGDWSEYYKFNALRGQFNDYNRLEKLSNRDAILEKIGWSQNDYTMLQNWFFADGILYNIQKFELVLSQIPASEKNVSNKEVVSFFSEIAKSFLFFHCIISFFLLLLLYRISRIGLIKIFGSILIVIIIFLYLIYFLKPPPERVYIPVIIYLSILPIICGKPNATIDNFKKIGISIMILLVLMINIGIVKQYKVNSLANLNNNIELKNNLIKLNPQASDLYIIWGEGFPFEYILPFDDISYLKNLHMIGLGANLRSPATQRTQELFFVNDLYLGLLKPNVYLILNNNQTSLIDKYNLFMVEHYSLLIEQTEVFRFENYVIVKNQRGLDDTLSKQNK